MAAKKRPPKKKASARSKAPKAKAKASKPRAKTKARPVKAKARPVKAKAKKGQVRRTKARAKAKVKVKTGPVKRAKVKAKVKVKVAPPEPAEPARPSLFEEATEAPLYDATGVFRLSHDLARAQRDVDEDEQKQFRDPSLVVSIVNGAGRLDDVGDTDDGTADD